MTFEPLTGSAGSTAWQRIGYLTTTQEIVHRTSEQTACNYDEITVPAGTEAEVFSNGYYVKVALPGTVTGSSWTDRVFSSSSTKTDEHVGQQRTYHASDYVYAAAEKIVKGEFLHGSQVFLDENVRIGLHQFAGRFHHGLLVGEPVAA